MGTLFEITANDIFRKFDMLQTRELGYPEFKGFYECLGLNEDIPKMGLTKELSEDDYSALLDQYCSTKVIC